MFPQHMVDLSSVTAALLIVSEAVETLGSNKLPNIGDDTHVALFALLFTLFAYSNSLIC